MMNELKIQQIMMKNVKSNTAKGIGELENIELVQSEVVIEEQSCFGVDGIQTEVKKSLNDDSSWAL